MPKEYRGSYAGYTCRAIAELMGCHENTAARYLKALEEELGGRTHIDKEHIGDLIYRYRNWKVLLGIYKVATERLPKPDYAALMRVRPFK